MTGSRDKEFINEIIRIIEKWSFEECAFCEAGDLITIEGMIDYKCSVCKKKMSESVYLGEIAKLVFDYQEKELNDDLKE